MFICLFIRQFELFWAEKIRGRSVYAEVESRRRIKENTVRAGDTSFTIPGGPQAKIKAL
jgi:hypothetical protein